MSQLTVKISGMTCNHCKTNVENNLKKLTGIESVVVNLAEQTAQIEGDNIDSELIKQTVEDLGYQFES
jgi:copper chaperone CopZ